MPAEKPEKPRPDFPLFPHASGQWAKTIRGRHHYFGRWADPQAALDKYLDQKDDLYAGRTPSNGDGLTVVQLVNHYLTSQQRRMESKQQEISPRHFSDCKKTCERVIRAFGRTTHVENLRPLDFEKLRATF